MAHDQIVSLIGISCRHVVIEQFSDPDPRTPMEGYQIGFSSLSELELYIIIVDFKMNLYELYKNTGRILSGGEADMTKEILLF